MWCAEWDRILSSSVGVFLGRYEAFKGTFCMWVKHSEGLSKLHDQPCFAHSTLVLVCCICFCSNKEGEIVAVSVWGAVETPYVSWKWQQANCCGDSQREMWEVGGRDREERVPSNGKPSFHQLSRKCSCLYWVAAAEVIPNIMSLWESSSPSSVCERGHGFA